MNKVLLISLAVMLGLSIGLVGCTGPAAALPDEIMIGMSRSTSGPLKDIHDLAFGAIYPIFFGNINTGGGMTVGSAEFDVNYDLYAEGWVMNDNSRQDYMEGNTRVILDAIDEGQCHFLFGPTCTAFLEAQAYICNPRGIVQMTAEGGATSIEADLDTLKYSFVNLSFSDWYQLPILAEMLDEAHFNWCGQHNATAYVAYIDDAHGHEYRDVAAIYFALNNIDIIDTYALPNAVTDLSIPIIDARDQNADIFCGFTYPIHVFGLAQAANASGYDANAFILGPGANFGVYGAPFMAGSLAEDVCSFAMANNKTIVAGGNPTMANLFNTILAPLSYYGQDFWGHPCYYAALQMWAQAAAAVGVVNVDGKYTIDQDAYRNYLANGNFTTCFGSTWYIMFDTGDVKTFGASASGGGMLSYRCHTGEIGQWQGGYYEVVGPSGIETDPRIPNYDTTNDFNYPKADW